MSTELVLVHLGQNLPSALKMNLKYLKNEYPFLPVTVIVNSIHNMARLANMGFRSELYSERNDIQRYFSNHVFSSDFRNGFWQNSTKRIIAFLEYCIENPLPSKIHIENDIHLGKNFPFQTFAKLEKLAWLSYNEHRDVGAIIYSPGEKQARWLLDQICKEMASSNSFTDMTLLKSVSQENENEIIKLPIASHPKDVIFNNYVAEKERMINSQHFETFKGVFDAAPIGMWLTGQDPRNHRGKLLLHVNHKDSYVNPSKVNWSYEENELSYKLESEVRVFNLHVHSKDRHVLSGEAKSIYNYVKITKNKSVIIRIKWNIILTLAKELILRLIKKITSR
jgi:hypothetical protein